MEVLEILGNASIVARLSMLVSIFPLGAGMAYVLRPSEQRLALMRPVSLAGLFAGLTGTVTGAINVLRGIWMSEGPVNWQIVAVGSAESLVTLLLAFGSLTVAWLCVAAGFRRQV
jgi:biopolymer transport protein ExbB/TolQ